MTIKFLRDDSERQDIEKLNDIFQLLNRPAYTSLDVKAAERFMKTVFLMSLKERKEEKVSVLPKLSVMQQSMLTAEDIPVPKPTYSDKIVEDEHSDDIIKAFENYYPLSILKDDKGVDLVRANLEHRDNITTYVLSEPFVDSDILNKTKVEIFNKVRKNSRFMDSDKDVYELIRKTNKKSFNDELGKKLMYYMKRDFSGFGKVDGLAHDKNVNGIYCDGIDKRIRISYGENLEIDTNVLFNKKEELNDFLKSLAFRMGKTINETNNMIDGELSGFSVKLIFGVGDVSSKFILKRLP